MESPSHKQAVATFVRSFRKSRGITLDTLAQAGRKYGAKWSSSSIQNIELGNAALTLPTLIHLALALGELSGQPLKLIDLLGPAAATVDKPGGVPPGHPVPMSWLERALSGDTVEVTVPDYQHARRASTVVNVCLDPGAPTASLAEDRAAKKLGLTTQALQEWAIRLWGKSLEAEAFELAGVGSTPQARGRVSRLLVAEIQESMAP